MSQHPSLKSSAKGAAHRSVLKRYERIKELKEKEKWDEKDSIYGLPKLKKLKFKIKKEKTEAKLEEGQEQDAAAAAAATPQDGKEPAKGAAPQAKKDEKAPAPKKDAKK